MAFNRRYIRIMLMGRLCERHARAKVHYSPTRNISMLKEKGELRTRPAEKRCWARLRCRAIFRGFRIEAPDFAGVDLGDWHLDGVFAFADFLVVLAVAQLAGNVDVLALLQCLSELREAAPDHDAMPRCA